MTRALGKFVLFAYGAIKSTEDVGDPTTADIFTEISRGLELRLWMLEAHTR
jgi:starvation-inducible DNA-binding protein